jgi:hypothetical protein
MSNAMNRLLEQHQRLNPTANTATASIKPTVSASGIAGKRVGLSVALAGIAPSVPSKKSVATAEDEGFGATGIPSRYKYPFKMPEGTWHIIVDFMRKGTNSLANRWSFSSPSNKVLPKPTILVNGIVKAMKANHSYHLFDVEQYDVYIRCMVTSKDPALRNSLHNDDTYSFGPLCIGYEGAQVTHALTDVKPAKVQILSTEHEPRIKYASGSNTVFGTKVQAASETMSDMELRIVTAAVNEVTTPAKYQTALRKLHVLCEGDTPEVIVDSRDKDGNAIEAYNRDYTVHFRIHAKRFEIFARTDKQKPWKLRETYMCPEGYRAGIVYVTNLFQKTFLARSKKQASASTETIVTAADKVSDRVASIVYGDIKRIKSTIAAWKGKMPEDQYKEFEKYQNFVAKAILKQYLPLVSDEYAKKIRAI